MKPTEPRPFILAENAIHLDELWCHVEKLCGPETTAPEHLLLVRATMPPGQAHNLHRHPGREEIIYVLEGQAEQWVAREKRLLGPGDLALIPRNVPHGTFNVGQGTLKFLAILSPVEAPGPFTVDVFDEEPWKTLRPPVPYPGYQPLRDTQAD
jgi:quercetin dioxygenase-like cupin family protein